MTTTVVPVPDGMRAAEARVASLRSLLGLRAPQSSGAAFAAALASEVGGTSAPAGAVSGDDAVRLASQQLGRPYVWGGADPATGFDCSGLVQYVYGKLGVDLPRTAGEQAQAGTAVPDLAHAKPGDLVAFGSPVDHIGIYAGNGTMIVAPHRGDVVRTQPITDTPTAIRRVTGGFDDLFAAAGTKYGVSPALLASVAKAESGLDPSAVSKAGAVGLMQLMPSTASTLGVDPRDPAQAVEGAARLLRSLLDSFGGSTELAVAAYNAGAGAVRSYGGVPPFPETQAYVRRVLAGIQGGN